MPASGSKNASLGGLGVDAYREKEVILNAITEGSLEINEETTWLRRLFTVLRSLEDPDVIRGILLQVYKFPLRKLDVMSQFRYAACHLDFTENYSGS